jgi:hypothetical protein
MDTQKVIADTIIKNAVHLVLMTTSCV